MLETLTLDTFTPLIGKAFRVSFGDGRRLDITLSEVQPLGGASGGNRTPFSLLFIGPRDPVLPQMIYHLENDVLDPLELFLVPIGPDQRGMRYEAIFT